MKPVKGRFYITGWSIDLFVKSFQGFLATWLIAIIALVVAAFSSNIHAAEPIPPNAIKHRADLTRIAHSAWGLDAPIPVFAAQIHQESSWNPQAVSKVGAQGMAQFMPATAKWMCEVSGTPANQCLPQNPIWAMRALVQYDYWLYARVWGLNDYDRAWAMLRAYNGGLGWWQREALMTTSRRLATREEIDAMCGKDKRSQIHCRENLSYPRRILNVYQPRYFGWGAKIVMGGSV